MLTAALQAMSWPALAALVVILVVSGGVKGALGIGMPLVAVPLSTQILDLPAVVGLLTVPMLMTNVGQAFEGGGTGAALRRLWPIMTTLVLGIVLGAHILVSIDRRRLYMVVGSALVIVAALMVRLPRIRFAGRSEAWAGAAAGLLAGLIGGLSGLFGPVLIAYLVGQRVDPDTFVKHIAILFTAATVALLLALGGTGTLSAVDLAVSTATMLPILFGMAIGRRLRAWAPPEVFRLAVLAVLALGGLDMLRRAFL